MGTRLSRFARTYLALLACVLVTCVPNGLLHLTVCECNGVLVKSDADLCPCASATVACSGSCSSDSDHECKANCCGGESGDSESGDSCCTDLPMPELLEASSSDSVVGQADQGPEPPFGAIVPTIVESTMVLDVLPEPTGPPGWHRIRRALAERAAVVLLI